MADVPSIRITAIDDASAVINQVGKSLEGLAAGILSVATVSAGLKSSLSFGDELQTMNEKIGVSVAGLQQLSAIAAQSSTDLEAFAKSFKNLAKTMVEAQDATSQQSKVFKALGVATKDAFGNLRDTNVVTEEVANALNSISDETLRAAAGTAIFGKGYLSIAAALRTFKQAQGEANDIIRIFGTVSATSAKAADNLGDRLKLIGEGFKAATLTGLTDGLIALESAFKAIQPTIATLSKAFGEFFGWLSGKVAESLINDVAFFETIAARIAGIAESIAARSMEPIRAAAEEVKKIEERRKAALAGIITAQASGGRSVDSGPAGKTTANAKALAEALNKAASTGLDAFRAAVTRLDEELARLTGADGGMTELAKANDQINALMEKGIPLTQAQIDRWQASASAIDELKKAFAAARFEWDEQNKQLEEARKNFDAYLRKLEEVDRAVARFQGFVQSIEQENKDREFQLSLLGRTADEIAILEAAYKAVTATQQERLHIEEALFKAEKEGNQELVDALTEQLTLLPQLGAARVKAATDGMQQEINYQNSFAGGWTRAFNAYQQGATAASVAQIAFNDLTKSMEDLFVGMAQHSKDAFKNFTNAVLQMIEQIGAKLVTSGIMSLLSGGTFASNLTGSVGQSAGGGVLGGIGKLFGGLFGGGGAAANAPLGSAESSLFGSAGFSIGSFVAANAVPIVGTILAVGGGLIYNWLESKKGGPKTGGFATSGTIGMLSGYTDASGRFATPSDADAKIKAYTDQTLKSFQQFATAFGLKGSAGFAQGFSSDPKGTAGGILHTQAFLNGRSVYDVALGDLGRDAQVLADRIALENKRALIAALKATDLPGTLSSLFKNLVPETITGDLADSLLTFAGAYKSLYDVFNTDPLDEALQLTEDAARGAQAALENQGEALLKLLDTYDGTGDATVALAKATQDYHSNLVSLLSQIEQVGIAISSMFADSIKQFTFAKLNKGGQYSYLQSEAASLTSQLGMTTDATMIDKLTKQIDADMREAFGLLDPAAQAKQADAFIKGANQVNALAQKQLEAAQKKAEADANRILTAIKTAIDAAADKFGAAADVVGAAGDDMQAAAGTISAAVGGSSLVTG